MNIEVERSINGQYLVIKDQDIDTSDDELCMLLNNNIPGFLCAAVRCVNGYDCIYYNVSSMMSLSDAVKRQELKYKEISEIIKSLIIVKNSVEEYLLADSGIIMSPEYVFYDIKEHTIKYCFYPFYKKEMSVSLNELAEFLLRFTDHTDKRSVKIIYELYSAIQSGDYDFGKYIENYSEKKSDSRLAGITGTGGITGIAGMTGRIIANAPVTKQFRRGYEYVKNYRTEQQDRKDGKNKIAVVIFVLLIAVFMAVLLVMAFTGLDLF